MQVRFRTLVVRAAVLTFTLIASVSAIAQTTGRITGQVSDPTGALVPDVKVTVVNEATGASRTAETSKGGDFVLPEIPVGTYRLEFEAKGFKKAIRRNVLLQLNQVVTVNQVMELGATQEVVDVTSEAPLVDTTSTQIGAVVDSHSVTELPLNARDTYQFLQLQPGVQSQLGGSGDLFYGSDRAGAVSVNGGRGRSNNFSVNGGDANDQFANLPTVQPSPDSIEEFRVLTNTFDAEYGRNSGAVVNVVTKSGTNQLHGNFYEFFRNKVLNSKGYFDTVKPDFQQNQYGATFGGPIKKDRTFFFVSYEGRRIKQGKSSDNVYVPTLQQTPTAQHPFSDFTDSGSKFGGSLSSDFVAQVLNSRPGCASALPGGAIPMPSSQGGSIAWSQIFPNATIPVQCMDPVAVDLMHQFMPAPNALDSFGVPYWQGVPNGRDHQEQGTLRLDHRITSRQNLSFYYYITDDDLQQPFSFFQAAGADVPGFGSNIGQRFQQYNLSHTWTLTNAIVNEARFAYNREAQLKFQHPQSTHTVRNSCTSAASPYCFTGTSESSVINAAAGGSMIGIDPNLGANHEGLPFIVISGGATMGNNFEGELPQVGNSFQWTDNLSWVKGNHTLKFGTDVRRMRFDQTLYYNVNGYYTVTGTGLNSIAQQTDPVTGQPIPGQVTSLYPDYLLGLSDSYSQGSAQRENVRNTALYLFAQDSWKMSKSVTLNYGLRWELNTPLTDILGHVQTFRPGQNTTKYPCTISAANIPYFQNYGIANPDCNNTGTLPTGIVFPGDKGVPAAMTTTDYKAWAPRIGLSWSPSADKGFLGKLLGSAGHTSIHTGYGIFYNPMEQLVLEQFGAEPPFGGSNYIANAFFNTPFIDQTGATYPNPFVNGILSPKPGTPTDWSNFRSVLLFGEFQPHLKAQYSEQYNFMIERQLRDDLLLQVGYVGSQGHHLLASHDLNPGNAQTCLDIQAIATQNPAWVLTGPGGSQTTCGPLGSDSSYYIDPNAAIPAGSSLHLPYGPTPVISGGTAGTTVGSVAPNGVFIVGTRPYSSPNCNPMLGGAPGTGCPVDGIPIFSNIFAEDTIANSSYNSLQAMVEKRYKHGLQLQGAYTWSKSFDWASSFEETLNPFNFHASRALSLFDSRHRFVLSYYWDIPTGKHNGALGKVVNGWAVSGISSFQSGFPIRLQTQDDTELITSVMFAGTAAPSLNGPLTFLNPKKNGNYWFDRTNFSDPPPGQFGNLKRTLCCGPGTNNTDLALHKRTNISETKYIQFRAEFFNLFNHTQFFNPDGNFSDGTNFGRITRARDPRLIQFGLKFYY